MAKGGYVGKILYVNLTDRTTKTIPTADYEEWGGGHGIGSALFFDLVKDKTIDGFHPDNLVTFMTSPMAGTLAPSASGRTEVQGIGIQAFPIPWFTRSNFGGRFSGMLKFAGWDGIAIQGAADKPVWLNIVNDKVSFMDAKSLWGLNTHETQEEIWSTVTGNPDLRDWMELTATRDGGRTTQKPAVVAIGPAGENRNRNGCLIHDAGNGSGQGGFGGILGAKNLKAISVLGTGSVPVADPAALFATRLELQKRFGYNVDAPSLESPVPGLALYGIVTHQPGYGQFAAADVPARPQGCMGCFKNCRMNFSDGVSNGNQCVESAYFMGATKNSDKRAATQYLDQMGVNVYDVFYATGWLYGLYKQGILGPGKKIDSKLPWEKYNTLEWFNAFTKCVAEGTDIGKDLKEGTARAAKKWGRWEIDTASGALLMPNWGFSEHYDPRIEVEWSYGSIFGDRDINEHGVNWHVHWMPAIRGLVGQEPLMSAEDLATTISKAIGLNDPKGYDYSAEGVYGDPKIAAVAWHRHYSRFWLQSMGMCDWAWPSLATYNNGDNHEGATGAGFEVKLYKAVTGKELTYEQSLELGRKIWNLDKAIWVLQGRHRDQEVFTGYVHEVPTSVPYPLPIIENGAWTYSTNLGRTLDRTKFEDVKTRFYKLEGWDPTNGWPTRKGLTELGLAKVADALEAAKRLGADA